MSAFQGRHCRLLTGKDALVAATSPVSRFALPPLPPLFSISQNPVKDQALAALAALPPVEAMQKETDTEK